jgi:hypothetical protein
MKFVRSELMWIFVVKDLEYMDVELWIVSFAFSKVVWYGTMGMATPVDTKQGMV